MTDCYEGFIEQLQYAETRKEISELKAAYMQNDELLKQAKKHRLKYLDAAKAAEKALRKKQDDATHADVKNWKPGTKVYFGAGCHIDHFTFSCKMVKGARVNKGDWCYVWQYQPRAKRLWLCQPGKKRAYDNVMNHCFTLRDVRDYKIGRTELELRK